MRSQNPREHGGTHTAGPTILEPAGNRFSDIPRKRQLVVPVALAPNRDLAGTPIDVGDLQRRCLRGTQPEPGQDSQDGEVSAPDRTTPITAVEQPGHLVGGDPLGNAGQLPARHRRHRTDQTVRRQPGHLQVAQELAQPGDDRLGRPDRAPTGLRQHEATDLTAGQVAKLGQVADSSMRQKAAGDLDIARDAGSLRQAPLLEQVGPILADDHVQRAKLRLGDARSRAHFTQMTKQWSQSRHRHRMRVASRLPRPQELPGPLRRQVAGAQPTTIEPTAQVHHES
jgi:hypothetical protein